MKAKVKSDVDSIKQVQLAIVHHANQYVITKGYADREGVGTILGLRQPGDRGPQRGLLPLLQMHLRYGIPLNLHLSGTLIEALTWYYPESFLLVKRLQQAGLLEIIGSAFSQNVMPHFSTQQNLRQLNEELWLLRHHLGWDLKEIKTFWVPERVWHTEKLTPVLRSRDLLNHGYRTVLLDDRHVFPVGAKYEGSARQRFDAAIKPQLDAFKAWRIAGGDGLLMVPFSKKLRYLIPPAGPEALRKIAELLTWLGTKQDAIAVYADDLEKAAGVGGWDHAHESRYEHFLRWLAENQWVSPVLINNWINEHTPTEERRIEPGTFYELAHQWKAGEDYRGWLEDPGCAEQQQYLQQAEQALIEAERQGADNALLEMGWKHLLHCSYETMWHNTQHAHGRSRVEPLPIEGWSAALCSHARSCLVIAEAAVWFNHRDGVAHAELRDIDQDGESELVLKNDSLFAVIAPLRGGRVVFLFDLTGDEGRLVIGNVSDDWNLQPELNRYMDHPRNHPGALAEVGHEHDRYEPIIAQAYDELVIVLLRNVEEGSPLHGLEKQVRLAHDAQHLCVKYIVPPNVWRLSTEACLSPDYYRLLRHGHAGVENFQGPDWRGWANGTTRAWLRLDHEQSTIWDEPYQNESGHGFNLRISSFSRDFHLEIGIGDPTSQHCPLEETALATPTHPVADPYFMRKYFEQHLPNLKGAAVKVQKCLVSSLSIHHDRLTLEYQLALLPNGNSHHTQVSLVGMWRSDNATRPLYDVLRKLWEAGFDGTDGLHVPQPLSYVSKLKLLLTDKAKGKPLKEWIHSAEADWPHALRRSAAWLAKLHTCAVTVNRKLTTTLQLKTLDEWRADLTSATQPWLAHEKGRIAALLAELRVRLRAGRKLPLCLVHGDFHPGNILLDNHTISVIDFEQCAMGHPASDLGYLLAQIDLQADKYWGQQGRANPFDIKRLRQVLFAQYTRICPESVLELVPLYQAQTYLKHLLYTLRMKGTEDPHNVTLWLDKAAAWLDA